MADDPSDSPKTRVEKTLDTDQKETKIVEPVEKQEDSQKPAGAGWAVVVGGAGDVETEEDRLRGEIDEQKERYKGLFKINEDLQIKYSGLKREHGKLEQEHAKLTSDPQYKGLQAQVEELRASKEESNNRYVALMDQNSQLKKKQNGKYALIGTTGAAVGFLAGLLFADCNGGNVRYAGHVRDAWDSGLYAQCSEVIDQEENQISNLEKQLADCKKDTEKLSKRPKYCPKPKKEEVVCPPVVNECPYIKQY